MPSRHPPSPERLHALLQAWRATPLSYTHRGGLEDPPESGFIVEEHRALLGRGEACWQHACAALDAWEMFPDWAPVHNREGQEPGRLVAMVTCICALWWVNPCRILRRCDGARTNGFVYGTLPEHAECGEEMFCVEKGPDGSVWYVIRAFSRPRHWMTWLGFPLGRWWQLRFVRDSQRRMQEAAAPRP